MRYLTQVTRSDSTGWTYKQWVFREARMPRVADDIIDCAIYLYPSRDSAAIGEQAGGSGFLLGVPRRSPEPLKPPLETIMKFSPNLVPWDIPHVYVVSNRHVVEKGICTIRLNTAQGEIAIFDTTVDDWYCHPEADLALYPLKLNKRQHRFTTVHYANILTEDIRKELDVGIGDDLMAVGRFINAEGYQKNTPVVRFGNIAAMPGEPIPLDIPDLNIPPQVSFLAEVRTLSGYSGSPVFLRIPHWELLSSADGYRQRLTKAVPAPPEDSATVFKLLGIAWGYIPDRPLQIFEWNQESAEYEQKEGWHTSSPNSGMMGVVPGWKLLDLLNLDELVELRKREEKRLSKRQAPGVAC